MWLSISSGRSAFSRQWIAVFSFHKMFRVVDRRLRPSSHGLVVVVCNAIDMSIITNPATLERRSLTGPFLLVVVLSLSTFFFCLCSNTTSVHLLFTEFQSYFRDIPDESVVADWCILHWWLLVCFQPSSNPIQTVNFQYNPTSPIVITSDFQIGPVLNVLSGLDHVIVVSSTWRIRQKKLIFYTALIS